jgi:hypothetical protein
MVAAGYVYTNVSRTLLFWSAFILTRPPDATVGDLLDKPIANGGLAWGRFYGCNSRGLHRRLRPVPPATGRQTCGIDPTRAPARITIVFVCGLWYPGDQTRAVTLSPSSAMACASRSAATSVSLAQTGCCPASPYSFANRRKLADLSRRYAASLAVGIWPPLSARGTVYLRRKWGEKLERRSTHGACPSTPRSAQREAAASPGLPSSRGQLDVDGPARVFAPELSRTLTAKPWPIFRWR